MDTKVTAEPLYADELGLPTFMQNTLKIIREEPVGPLVICRATTATTLFPDEVGLPSERALRAIAQES